MATDENIQSITAEVRRRFEGEASGHDWWHIERVRRMAKRIGAEEALRHPSTSLRASAQGINLFVIELASLLHDIADWKFHDGDDTAGSREALQEIQAKKNGVE